MLPHVMQARIFKMKLFVLCLVKQKIILSLCGLNVVLLIVVCEGCHGNAALICLKALQIFVICRDMYMLTYMSFLSLSSIKPNVCTNML